MFYFYQVRVQYTHQYEYSSSNLNLYQTLDQTQERSLRFTANVALSADHKSISPIITDAY